jgi:hypothetical protein
VKNIIIRSLVLLILLGAYTVAYCQGHLHNRGVLEGKITNQLGYPLAEIWISVVEVGGESRTFQSRADGSFWIELPAGIYTVSTRDQKSQLYKEGKIQKLKLYKGDKVALDIVLRASPKALKQLNLGKNH